MPLLYIGWSLLRSLLRTTRLHSKLRRHGTSPIPPGVPATRASRPSRGRSCHLVRDGLCHHLPFRPCLRSLLWRRPSVALRPVAALPPHPICLQDASTRWTSAESFSS